MSADVLAPAMLGPKISRPISDWRNVAPRVASGREYAEGLRIVGKIQIVGASDVSECVHQNDAVNPRAILGSALDLGLILFVDL